MSARGGAGTGGALTAQKLVRGLGTIAKPNPMCEQWTPMQLYLESQVRGIAHRRHGGGDGVDAERERRTTARLGKKRQREKREKAVEQVQEAKAKKAREEIAALGQAHVHDFEEVEGPGGTVIRKCALGVKPLEQQQVQLQTKIQLQQLEVERLNQMLD